MILAVLPGSFGGENVGVLCDCEIFLRKAEANAVVLGLDKGLFRLKEFAPGFFLQDFLLCHREPQV